jgi:hypothetical protein
MAGYRGCRPRPPSRSRSAGLGRPAGGSAALEVADPALAAGAVAGQAPTGTPGTGSARPDMTILMHVSPARVRMVGPGTTPVEGDLARSKAEAVQPGKGLAELAVLAGIVGCAGRREQMAGVGGDLGQLAT